jgi:membrane fusion protein (multidrug efflux system)
MYRLRRRLLRFFLLVVVPFAVVAAGVQYYLANSRYVTTENAYVKATQIAVSAEVSGRAVEIPVDTNQRVRAGDVLFRIDPAPFELDLAKAEAEIGRVRNDIEVMRSSYREVSMALAEAEQNLQYNQRAFDRQRTLEGAGVASRAKFDEAQNALAMNRERVRALRQKMNGIQASLGGRVDLPTAEHPMFLEAVAKRDRAALDLVHAVVRAPVDGIAGKVNVELGEFVNRGQMAIALVQSQEPYIEANVKETRLTHVRVGQRATVVIDTYPDFAIRARVKSISPSTGAEFAILPPQNATGNWVKIVQWVPIRLELEGLDERLPLRAGMTATVRIDTERETSLGDFLAPAFAWTGFGK